MSRDPYLLREDAKVRDQSRGGRARRVAASSIAATVVTTALIVTYFRAEVAAYVTRYSVHEDSDITEQVERQLIKSAALLQEAKAAQAMTAIAKPQRAPDTTRRGRPPSVSLGVIAESPGRILYKAPGSGPRVLKGSNDGYYL